MTGDVNLTHIRERVERLNILRCQYEQDPDNIELDRHKESCREHAERETALAQLAAAEAVIQAARGVAASSSYDGKGGPWVVDAAEMVALCDALAALEDGQ